MLREASVLQEYKNAENLTDLYKQSDLIFSLQTLTVKPSYGKTKQLWMFGVDQNGYSVAFEVDDFHPTFLFKALEEWNQEEDLAEDDLLEWVEGMNKSLRPTNPFPDKEGNNDDETEDKILTASFEYRIPFIGFTNMRKDRLCKITCNSIADFYDVTNALKKQAITLYHDDFDMTNQFLQYKLLSYGDWLLVSECQLKHKSSYKSTSCNLEGTTNMGNISKYDGIKYGEIRVKTPPLIKAFIRIKAISRDGVIQNIPEYHPNPAEVFDRLIAIGVSYVWSGNEASDPIATFVFSILPSQELRVPKGIPTSSIGSNLDSKVQYIQCSSEQELLLKFRENFNSIDPDDLFYFPDYYETLSVIAQRAILLKYEQALQLDRFKNSKPRIRKEGDVVTGLRLTTRSMFDIEKFLKKKVFKPVESYDLYTISCTKEFRKEPCQRSKLLDNFCLANEEITHGFQGYKLILDQLTQDLTLLRHLERDTGLRMEIANIGKIGDTSCTSCIFRGEQIRVYNKLTRFCLQEEVYVNREMTAKRPLKFNIKTHPPTYVDCPELLLNTKLREKCTRLLNRNLNYRSKLRRGLKAEPVQLPHGSLNKRIDWNEKHGTPYLGEDIDYDSIPGLNDENDGDGEEKKLYKQVNLQSVKRKRDDDDEDEDYNTNQMDTEDDEEEDEDDMEVDEEDEGMDNGMDEEEKEGGNVVKPAPGLWFGPNKRLNIFDFASLYPSLMMAYTVCYRNLVYDKQYLNVPGVKYIWVAINKYETTPVVQMPGIIDKLLKELVAERAKIKKKMKTEKDKFKTAMLDNEQNSMKVYCNGTYGFCGAEKKGSLLAVKEVMYIVTSIGRFLQKDSSTYLANKYGIPTAYGDTDSIFEWFLYYESNDIEEICLKTGRHYEMDGFLTGEISNIDGTKTNQKLPFIWENVKKHWATKKWDKGTKLVNIDEPQTDIPTKEVYINAIAYLIGTKLCEEVSHRFLPPVKLEFENMADNCWMSHRKKNYMYRLYLPDHPGKIDKIKVTGMPSKKREWCQWNRRLLKEVSRMICYGQDEKIKDFIEIELNKLASGQVSISDLAVTRQYKSELAYKSLRQIHLQVVKKEVERNRWPVKENSRVSFMVTKGNDKLYMRGAASQTIKKISVIDLEYYIAKQFYKPMQKLLAYHPQLFDFETLYNKYLAKAQLAASNLSDLNSTVTKRKLTLEDIREAAKAKAPVTNTHKKQRKKYEDEDVDFCI